MARTFIVWDSHIDSLHDPLDTLREEGQVVVRPLPGDLGIGRIWADNVRPDLEACERVLAVVDEPNANMAFELGYALGLGKPWALVAASQRRATWVDRGLLTGLLMTTGAEDLHVLRKVLATEPWAPAVLRPVEGHEPRVLVPHSPTASTAREKLETAFHRRLLLHPPPTLDRLPVALASVGRVAWVLPSKSLDPEPHREAIAHSAVVAGFACALGCPLTVLRSAGSDYLADVLHLDQHRWSKATDLVAEVRRWLGPDADAFAPATGADPTDLIARWRYHVSSRLERSIPFLQGVGERPLSEVCVELCVEERRGEKGRGGTPDDVGTPSGPLTVERYLRRYRRAAVLGEPGAGKTTMLRRLACRLAEDPAGPVPVYLPVARFFAEGKRPDHFDPYALAEAEAGLGGLAQALRARGAGQVWVLLDGLDEVPRAHMERLREDVSAFVKAQPGALLLVSGRPVVEGLRAIPADFQRANLLPLSPDEQEELAVRQLGAEGARGLMAALRAEPAVAELGRNPFLMTLLTLVAREGGAAGVAFPRRRTQLYERAVKLLLERGYGPEPRGVKDPTLARELLRRLSLKLQGEPGEAWEAGVLRKLLWDLVLADEELGAKVKYTWDNVDRLVEDLGTNSGVLGPFEGHDQPWRYLHRSLREYLAAERLHEEGPVAIRGWVGMWTKALKEFEAAERKGRKAVDPARWGEVHALLCGLVSDPLPLLKELREVNPGLARRALRSVELEPGRALGFLLEDTAWEEEDVEALGRRYGAELRRPLHERIRRDTPLRLAAVAYEVLGEEPARFFERWGRALGPAPGTVLIEAGTFRMGSPPGVGEDIEHPSHLVTVTRPFRLGVTPVTEAEWAVFMGEGPASRRPAAGMNWYEARLYAAWAGGDLPTEAEWEFACRAGNDGLWCFGDDERLLWRYCHCDLGYDGKLAPVASLLPNRWGLYDMHGSVWEFCSTIIAPYPQANPSPIGVVGARVWRGGALREEPDRCRSAYRSAAPPSARYDTAGLRVRLPAP